MNVRMDPYLAMCSCGRARRGHTLGVVSRWADWHLSVGGEGTDHVLWVGYDGTVPKSTLHNERRSA